MFSSETGTVLRDCDLIPFFEFSLSYCKNEKIFPFPIVQFHKEHFSLFQFQCEFFSNLVYSDYKLCKVSENSFGPCIDVREYFSAVAESRKEKIHL